MQPDDDEIWREWDRQLRRDGLIVAGVALAILLAGYLWIRHKYL